MVVNAHVISVQNSCDFIINSVRNSSLNFSSQETPYSLYLTIRKSFAESKAFPSDPNSSETPVICEMEELKCKVKDVEKINDGLKHDYE